MHTSNPGSTTHFFDASSAAGNRYPDSCQFAHDMQGRSGSAVQQTGLINCLLLQLFGEQPEHHNA